MIVLGVCQFFFFFQAEDGIRDLTVTGVQTCALPITVSEYSVLPMGIPAARQAAALRARAGRRMLTIVKDLPQDSPLLPDADNAHARALAQALADAGFILVEGQALAHVPIDFSSLDE